VLLYHRVASHEPDVHRLCVPPEAFRAQMELLARELDPVDLGELVEGARAGSVPERAVAVTFDDGYLDALETASPILAELGIPATFFVCTDGLDDPGEAWWDRLERALED